MIAGDYTTLNAARTTAREKFDQLRSLTAPEKLNEALAHAQSVTKILRENVVQGTQIREDTYKLNIHEHTERGDNATAKKMEKRVLSFKDLKAQRF